jgi:hypothetical protein
MPFPSIPGISNASSFNENLSPFLVFHIFANKDIISDIKIETNRYAEQKIEAQKEKDQYLKSQFSQRGNLLPYPKKNAF